MANQNIASALNFHDATRAKAKACIVIQGVSGKGKSGLALLLGYFLSGKNWQKEYAVDTENKSLNLYVGIRLHNGVLVEPFKKLDLTPSLGYAPTNFLLCKEAAKKQGGLVIINDSISHMWQMKGGVLQRVSELDSANRNVNKFSAWGTPEIVEEKNAIYDVVRDSDIHVISTVRVKIKHEQVLEDGKTKIKSLGEQQIFMPDFEYEPDLVLDMVSPGTATGTPPAAKVLKSRYAILEVDKTYSFTDALCEQLVAYLNEGADPEILKEQQRLELIHVTTEILNKNPSKATMFPLLKEKFGVKDVALADLPLNTIRDILGVLIN